MSIVYTYKRGQSKTNQLAFVAEPKNKQARDLMRSLQSHRLVYAKWRGGKLVKAVYEGVI